MNPIFSRQLAEPGFNNALHTAFGPGISFRQAETDVYTLDGEPAPPIKR